MLLILLSILFCLGLLLGGCLIFKPVLMSRATVSVLRRVFIPAVSQWPDRIVSIERGFYRNHKLMGGLIVAGAIYILLFFSVSLSNAHLISSGQDSLPVSLLEVLLMTARILFLSLGVLILLLGAVVIWRPSLLRDIETKANRWVSLGRFFSWLAVFEWVVMHHARKTGVLLSLLSLGGLFFIYQPA